MGWCSAASRPTTRLVEIIELPDHPFFLAGQFHPEFKSRPNRPHPVFVGLVRAALEYRARRSERAHAAIESGASPAPQR
jgi:CTP synthase